MKASNIDIGDLNPLRILRAIWLRPGISRAELARGLGLDKSTITKLVPALLDAGVIADIEKRSSGPNGGRKPISLRINSAYGCVLGLEIQTDCFLATVVDLDGEVLLQLTESFDQAGYGLMEGLQKALSVMKRRMKTLSAPLVGIGLGLPGIVDPHRGMVLECRPFQIAQPFDFFEELRRRPRCPFVARFLGLDPSIASSSPSCAAACLASPGVCRDPRIDHPDLVRREQPGENPPRCSPNASP